jgi:hypothetical protein
MPMAERLAFLFLYVRGPEFDFKPEANYLDQNIYFFFHADAGIFS